MHELVEMEIKELLEKYGYDADSVQFIKGSALCALNGTNQEIGEKSVLQLIDAMDSTIVLPERDID